ncbi:MAG: two pore domain potassium channel family protein [Phycisphaerales bacterium]|nr:MAG: two pore domain potassium channel family protein [Phycisphaerales bacterium]
MQTTVPQRQLKSRRAWVMEHRFSVLLCALVVVIFAAPIVSVVRERTPTLFSRVLVLACFSLMLLSALFAISRSRHQLIAAALLSVPSVILLSVNAVQGNDHVRAWGYVLTILFLGYTIFLIVAALFRQRTITGDIICASLCAYLLLGMFWAHIYSLTEILLPGSFSRELNVSGAQSGYAFYHSFVTLSTLGYGDVTPLNPIARVFSYSEAIAGQIYLAVLVARLVGLHISQTLIGKEAEQ